MTTVLIVFFDFFRPMKLRFQYIMRCHQRGTLMRYYLLLSLPVTLLPGGIIETPGPCGLILFTGPLK
jgi:hypothetical protein